MRDEDVMEVIYGLYMEAQCFVGSNQNVKGYDNTYGAFKMHHTPPAQVSLVT